MLPSLSHFQSKMSELGISVNDHVVVYDTTGYGAARVYWMFKVFGHDSVSLLDGGLNAFKLLHPLDTNPVISIFEVITNFYCISFIE